jgi:proteasome lid subunit RPN8/RPN11
MRIPPGLRQEMLDHLLACLPEEGCGLLAGREGVAEAVLPVENELHSPVRYRMRGQAQLRAFQHLETGGLDLLAIFHSHPSGPAAPSATDIAEFCYPGVLTLIAAPEEGTWKLRAFAIGVGSCREVPLEGEEQST